MSDMLTHWASFDDCRILAQKDNRIEPAFRTIIHEQRAFARFGSLTFGGTQWMTPTLRNAREYFANPKLREKGERNIAFVLGGLIHQACDRVMKPVLTEASGYDWSVMQKIMKAGPQSIRDHAAEVAKTQEVSAYFDAEVFREVYLAHGQEPFTSLFMGVPESGGSLLEESIRAMFQRSLLSSHTLKPDFDHMEDWLDNLFGTLQPLFLEVPHWVEAYQHPDPQKVADYGIAKFYDPADPTIKAARLLQQGLPLDPKLEAAVYEHGEITCAYGNILQTGLGYLRSASAYWRGEEEEVDAPNYVSAAAMAYSAQSQ